MVRKREVRIGLEVLRDDAKARGLGGARLGLIAHPASVTRDLEHAVDVIQEHPELELRSLFGPQHGARGEKQDNMIESAPFRDSRAGLAVHSLYGVERKPTTAMLADVDVLLFDLQDVGVRIYTFIWTMALAMQACREHGKRFVVLDRPNPIGGLLREGPMLRRGFESFVGLYPLPLRHGLTTGEVARYLNTEEGIGCELEVIACEGWSRVRWLDEISVPYVMPSPNLPTLDSCVVFPGTVLLEGTNLSEGRGTTRPFELIGAPFLDGRALAEALAAFDLEGVHFRPCQFEPTFQKHAGSLCSGVQLHVFDRESYRPVETGVAVLSAARAVAGEAFAWREPPYEYEEKKPPIDILWGSDALRTGIDAGQTPREILAGSEAEIARFEGRVEPYLLYE